MIAIMNPSPKGGGSSLRDGVAAPNFDNTSVFSTAISRSTAMLLEISASVGAATPSRIVLLLQKQTKRAVAAAAVASYRLPANESSLAGTLRYATLAGVCNSTPPPTTQKDRGGSLLRVRYAHSTNTKAWGLKSANE